MISATTQKLEATCQRCGAANPPVSRFCAQCGNGMGEAQAEFEPPPPSRGPPANLADPLIGMVIADRYRILSPIGRGGMGVVYKVEHTRIGKLMALKLLTGELTTDGELVARFKREALMVSKLSHPNTVQVFDFGTTDGLTYLAMEYLDGRDLGRVIEESGRIDPIRLAKLTIQICSSLAEAHDQGMIHRDLKPENLILLEGRADGELIKVLDFGLAKLRESSELVEVTTRGAIVGTPYYMSPEQVRGEAVDQRSDLYSLGALMYKALTGKPVFDAATPVGVLTKHLTDDAQAPSMRFPEYTIPESFSRIVMRLLNKDREQRFQSVKELQAALVAELESAGATSGVDYLLDSSHMREQRAHVGDTATRDEVERYERKLRRRGQLVWVLLTGVLAAIGFGGYKLYKQATWTPAFSGSELEPNDVSAQANPLPYGEPVTGQLGRRIDKGTADRDFYRVTVPDSVVALSLSGLPNLAHCLSVFQVGLAQPFGRYCAGRPGLQLEVAQLRLTPGAYLLMVTQDTDDYDGRGAPAVLENISDSYTLRVTGSAQSEASELEPNDNKASANVLRPGDITSGALNWMRDVDVFCAELDEPFALQVDDRAARPRNSVLQVVPLGGPSDGIPLRVYPENSSGELGTSDTRSPYRTPATTGQLCVKLSLIPDPASPLPHPRVAAAGPEKYQVSILRGNALPQGAPSSAPSKPRLKPKAEPSPQPPPRAPSASPSGAAPTPAATTPSATSAKVPSGAASPPPTTQPGARAAAPAPAGS